jgi:outer membrane lipoprotein-sorting protein
MTTNDAPSPGDLITQVINAFDGMRVPPGPTVLETVELLEQRAVHKDTTVLANNAAGRWTGLAVRCTRLTLRQRIAVGSIGLSTAVGLVLLLLALNSGTQLSAMERMAKKLHEVKSYSYKLSTENTFVKEGRTQPTYVKRTGTAYWLAPSSFFAEEKIVHIDVPIRSGDDKGGLVAHFTEIYPAGKPGIIINHKAKTFYWLPVVHLDDFGTFSPINQLRMVRERSGTIVRDLGTKTINGKPARGYVMALKNATPGSGRDALEFWVDPETDLPLEFGYTIKNDQGPEFFRVTDCRWNIEVDPQLFATTPPKGYTDVTPPATNGDSVKSSRR